MKVSRTNTILTKNNKVLSFLSEKKGATINQQSLLLESEEKLKLTKDFLALVKWVIKIFFYYYFKRSMKEGKRTKRNFSKCPLIFVPTYNYQRRRREKKLRKIMKKRKNFVQNFVGNWLAVRYFKEKKRLI